MVFVAKRSRDIGENSIEPYVEGNVFRKLGKHLESNHLVKLVEAATYLRANPVYDDQSRVSAELFLTV